LRTLHEVVADAQSIERCQRGTDGPMLGKWLISTT